MFERFRSAKKVLRADKTAQHIISFLEPCLILVWADGGLNPKLQSDEFVLGYIYGVIAAFLDAVKVSDQEEVGWTIRQVFERLFPSHGKSVTELCNQKAIQKNSEFARSVPLGYTEMIEVFNADGQKILDSLLYHVSNSY
ncbi:MAG TPA: hypothetical protein VGJ33_10195 [Candidatus Angelobacter sp.]|jgi:hypothetical protein